MLIKNTTVEARHPWPDGMRVQGGGHGVVFVRGTGDSYETAFVEAFPSRTFIRGEGATVEDAEDACWAKYLKVVTCTGGGEHGPYEARDYENGSGFCTKCGTWFPDVLEPSLACQAERTACDVVIANYGADIPGSRWWKGLVEDTTANLLARLEHRAIPAPAMVPPTAAELQAFRESRARRFDPAVMHALLEKLAGGE